MNADRFPAEPIQSRLAPRPRHKNRSLNLSLMSDASAVTPFRRCTIDSFAAIAEAFQVALGEVVMASSCHSVTDPSRDSSKRRTLFAALRDTHSLGCETAREPLENQLSPPRCQTPPS